jgi:hypothetical protein
VGRGRTARRDPTDGRGLPAGRDLGPAGGGMRPARRRLPADTDPNPAGGGPHPVRRGQRWEHNHRLPADGGLNPVGGRSYPVDRHRPQRRGPRGRRIRLLSEAPSGRALRSARPKRRRRQRRKSRQRHRRRTCRPPPAVRSVLRSPVRSPPRVRLRPVVRPRLRPVARPRCRSAVRGRGPAGPLAPSDSSRRMRRSCPVLKCRGPTVPVKRCRIRGFPGRIRPVVVHNLY